MVSIFATPSWPLSCTAFQLLKGFFLPRAPRHDPTLQDTLTFPNDAQAALIILKTVLLRRLPITASSVNNLVRAHRGLPSRTFYLQTPKESAPKGRWQLVIPHESPLSRCLPALLPPPITNTQKHMPPLLTVFPLRTRARFHKKRKILEELVKAGC